MQIFEETINWFMIKEISEDSYFESFKVFEVKKLLLEMHENIHN